MSAALAALAAVAAPVVHTGAPEAAVERVRRAAPGAGVLVPRDWVSVTSEPAGMAEGGAASTPCAGGEAEPVDAAAEAAWSAFLYGEFASGADRLAQAASTLACLDAPVDPAALARLRALEALLRLHAGDEAAAAVAWRAARAADPTSEPGADWPPASAERLRATPAEAPIPLRVVAGTLAVHVDGRPAGEAIAPGRHLVQAAGAGAWVDVLPSDRATLVVPGAYSPRPLGALLDEPEVLASVLAVVFGPGAEVWVAADGRLARLTAGRAEVVLVEEPVPDAVVEEQERRAGRRTAGLVIGVSGGALALVGAASAVGSSVAASVALADYAAASTPDEAVRARERFTSAAAWVAPAEWVTAGGVGVASVGVVVALGGRR